MDSSVQNLFDLARKNVREQDFVDFSPRDPGYPDYVRYWIKIHRSDLIPKKSEFDLTEVILLTMGAFSNDDDSTRFKAFRNFTRATGLGVIQFQGSHMVLSAADLVHDLLFDIDKADMVWCQLLRESVAATRMLLIKEHMEGDYPFLSLAEIILAQIMGDFEASEIAAKKLIADENTVREDCSLNFGSKAPFLFGLAVSNHKRKSWVKFASEISNPNGDSNLQFVMNSICATD